MIVSKFGGSSVASKEQFEKVKSGIGSGVAAVQEKVGEGVEAVKGEAKENARVH